MSDRLDSFKSKANNIAHSLDVAKRYLNIIKISETPECFVDSDDVKVIIATPPIEDGQYSVQITLPSIIEHGIFNYEAYIKENNEEKLLKVKIVEMPLADTIHEINMFLKRPLTSLMNLALEMGHWIRLKIPKIEDGNNNGIRIQEMILTDIDSLKNLLLTVEKYQDGYFSVRTKILSTIYTAKRLSKGYRENVARRIEVLDIDHIDQFEIHILEIELELEYIFDKCKKNLEKLMNPNDTDALNLMF